MEPNWLPALDMLRALLLLGMAAPQDDWFSDHKRGLWVTCLIGGFFLTPLAPPLGVIMLIVSFVCLLGQCGALLIELGKWSGKQIDALPSLLPPPTLELPPPAKVPTKEELLNKAKERRDHCRNLITAAALNESDTQDLNEQLEEAYRFWVDQIVKR